MKRAGHFLKRLLYPSSLILILVSVISFVALIYVFIYNQNKSILAYIAYGLSAYSLTALIAVLPKALKKAKLILMKNKLVKKVYLSKTRKRYLHDLAFRGNISIYQGMIANFLYVVFKTVTGIKYSSVWFLSIAGYYLVLGILRAYLAISYKRQSQKIRYDSYLLTAILLIFLNIPMGITIMLMIKKNSEIFYPEYVIYISAMYTFYTIINSIINIVKFKKIGNPVLSAAKALDFIAAMMSVLGLQTAMISHFSEKGDGYRIYMNTITGTVVYLAVTVIALYMIIYVFLKVKKGVKTVE